MTPENARRPSFHTASAASRRSEHAGATDMNVLIVDDEPLARLRLRSLLLGLPELDINIVGEAGDAHETLALLNATPVDAVLLDIRMPGLTPRHRSARPASRPTARWSTARQASPTTSSPPRRSARSPS